MSRSAKEAARALSALAHEQGGYFTTKQAKEAGYGYRHLDYHETAGNFERIAHGLYRLPTIPRGEHDELIRLSLWSRNQEDMPQAVVSHESALVLQDLTELLPDRIHLTVPPKFRKATPRGCVLHKALLAKDEIEERAGFRLTTPLRTLLDATLGGVSQEQLEKAVKKALSGGLVRESKLLGAAKHDPSLERLRKALGGRKIAAK
jgi:predicted transcriptional regulator of viral defense system